MKVIRQLIPRPLNVSPLDSFGKHVWAILMSKDIETLTLTYTDGQKMVYSKEAE